MDEELNDLGQGTGSPENKDEEAPMEENAPSEDAPSEDAPEKDAPQEEGKSENLSESTEGLETPPVTPQGEGTEYDVTLDETTPPELDYEEVAPEENAEAEGKMIVDKRVSVTESGVATEKLISEMTEEVNRTAIEKPDMIESWEGTPVELQKIDLKESVTESGVGEEEQQEEEEEEEEGLLDLTLVDVIDKARQQDTRVSGVLSYNFTERFPTEVMQDVRLSGDFQPYPKGRDPTRLLRSFDSIYAEEIEEIQKTRWYAFLGAKTAAEIDRSLLKEKVESLRETLTAIKIRNALLQRHMGIYMRKHGLEHMLRERDIRPETMSKYKAKLNSLEEHLQRNEIRTKCINIELNNIKKRKDLKKERLEKAFCSLQQREIEVSKGLTYLKSGNDLSERTITLLTTRQKRSFTQLSEMRMRFYQLRTMVQDKEIDIERLNLVGHGLYLFNFEVLKSENRIYIDKIEEKDEELSRLRTRSRKLIQMLAHVREKSCAVESDIEDLYGEIANLEIKIDGLRRILNEKKQERDNLRQQLEKLKIETGLLSENILLKDMETSLEEYEVYKKALHELQKSYNLQTKQLRNLRRTRENMEIARRASTSKLIPDKRKKTLTTQPRKKSRPSVLSSSQTSRKSVETLDGLKPSVKRLSQI